MKLKSKNGYTIELMVVFMLVVFAFCTLITIYVSSMMIERKSSKTEIDNQTVFDQIGEYYLRCVEAGGVFPTNCNNLTYSSAYAWMDDNGDSFLDVNNDETYKFFKSKNFTYEDKISITYGTFAEFYRTKGVWRRLTVKSGTNKKMILTVKEDYVSNISSNCKILTWYIGDGLTSNDEADGFKTTTLSILQKLWMFLGRLVNKATDVNLFSSSTDFNTIREFFNFTVDTWQSTVQNSS